jgi:hypothetical protein
MPPDLVDPVSAWLSVTSRHVSTLTQAVLCDFLAAGHFVRHLRRMRDVYAERLAALLDGAARLLHGRLEVTAVEVGLQTVGYLAGGVSVDEVTRALATRDVEVRPLARYARTVAVPGSADHRRRRCARDPPWSEGTGPGARSSQSRGSPFSRCFRFGVGLSDSAWTPVASSSGCRSEQRAHGDGEVERLVGQPSARGAMSPDAIAASRIALSGKRKSAVRLVRPRSRRPRTPSTSAVAHSSAATAAWDSTQNGQWFRPEV